MKIYCINFEDENIIFLIKIKYKKYKYHIKNTKFLSNFSPSTSFKHTHKYISETLQRVCTWKVDGFYRMKVKQLLYSAKEIFTVRFYLIFI